MPDAEGVEGALLLPVPRGATSHTAAGGAVTCKSARHATSDTVHLTNQ